MHGEGKEELLHNGFPHSEVTDRMQFISCGPLVICCVWCFQWTARSRHMSNPRLSKLIFLENPPLFSDLQCKLCTGSWEGNHIFFMIMCMLLLHLSCPLTRRLPSFTLVFNSPLLVLVSAYFCQLHVSFFVFLCLPVHAGPPPPLLWAVLWRTAPPSPHA